MRHQCDDINARVSHFPLKKSNGKKIYDIYITNDLLDDWYYWIIIDGKLLMGYTPNRAPQSSKINEVAEVGVVLAISFPNPAEMEYAVSFWDNWTRTFFSDNTRSSIEMKQRFTIMYLLDYYIFKYQDYYSTEEAFMWNFFENNLGLKRATEVRLRHKGNKIGADIF